MIKKILFILAGLLISVPASAALNKTLVSWDPAPGPVAYYSLEASLNGSPFEEIARITAEASEVEIVMDPDAVYVARVGACNSIDVCVYGPEGVLVPAPPKTPDTTDPGVPGLPGAPFSVSVTVNIGTP